MTNDLKERRESIRTASTRWDSSWQELAGEDERGRLFSYLESRFAIPAMLFNDYLLFKGTAGWWLMKNESPVMAASELKVVKCGLKAFQKIGHFVKPTTRMIQIFGHAASRARFEIEATELSRLIAGEELPVKTDLDTGYVILGLRRDIILGLGFLINGKIRSQLPLKQIRQAMVETL